VAETAREPASIAPFLRYRLTLSLLSAVQRLGLTLRRAKRTDSFKPSLGCRPVLSDRGLDVAHEAVSAITGLELLPIAGGAVRPVDHVPHNGAQQDA